MLNIAKLKNSKSNKPYTLPLKARVGGVSGAMHYQVDGGEKKEYKIIGVADSTGAIKCILYDRTKEKTLQNGNSVILMNYIFKTEPSESIIITKNSKVMKTSNLEVGQELLDRAELIANPPPAVTIPIKKAKTSPVKTLVSIQGRVVSEDMIKTVKVKGNDVQVKSVTLKDETDCVKVSLWRNLSDSAAVGKFLSLTDVVVTSFNDEVSVSTTSKTTIQEKEPPSSSLEGTVVGYEVGDNCFTVLFTIGEDFQTFTIALDILVEFLECTDEEVENTLQQKLPFSCRLQVKDSSVESITNS